MSEPSEGDQAAEPAGAAVDAGQGAAASETAPTDYLPRIGAAPRPAPLPISTGLHTNTRWTLSFVALIGLITVAAWGSAKVACNYHPAQSRKFKVASLDKLASRPKNAALEFHHSLFTQRYERAAELATEHGQALVDAAREACDASCRAEREVRTEHAKTRAILYRISGAEAWAKAQTFFDHRVNEETYRLQRKERRWLVVEAAEPPPLAPADPATTPHPVAPPDPATAPHPIVPPAMPAPDSTSE
jgi:hypothetical protein